MATVATLGGGVLYRTCRLDDDGVAGAAPDRNVGARVAGIVEAVRESFGENLRLRFALQIAQAVAADDAANEGNPPHDLFRDLGVGGGGDIDRPSARRDIGRVGQQFFIERQNVRLDVGFLGETALEIGAATQHPQADLEQPPRRGSKQRQHGLEQHVRAHQRAVEIEDQRPRLRRLARSRKVSGSKRQG